MSVDEEQQVATASAAVVDSTWPSKLHVNESCLEVLRYLKDCGLLDYSNDVTNDHDDRLVASWCSRGGSNNGTDNNKIQFDEYGFVSSLDLGGKRLHRGFPLPGQTLQKGPKPADTSRMVLPPFDKLQRLKTLNLAGTDLPLNDTVKVLEMVQSTIEVLYLGGNGLGVAGGKAIALWLSGLPTVGVTHLVKLDLRYNDLGDEGTKALCLDGLMKMTAKETVKDCCSVRQLYMEGNGIGDSGMEALARLLNHQGKISKEAGVKESYGIREVYLGANKISHVGAQSLASTLHTNKMISRIYLEGNQIGLQGANAFSVVLEQLNGNTGLQQLFVDNNNIGKEGSKRLAQALNTGTAIGDMIDM